MTKNLSNATVLVVGAGIMGAGIAQVAALAGHSVLLHDARADAAAQARASLAATFETLVAKGKLPRAQAAAALERVQPAAALHEAAGATLVVEAIVGTDAVLATNTSSIPVTAIANGLAHPQRLVGMHFFNPVPLMKLVEVISGLHTDPAVAEAVCELTQIEIAPLPVADTPGLVVARTVAMLVNEAADAVQQGVCSAEGADAAMKLGVNYPAGPFEWLRGWSVGGVAGMIGALDVCYRGERYRLSPWLQRGGAAS